MARGSNGWRRLMEYLDSSRDAFGWDVRLGTRNNADIGAQYPYSPERWRLSVNGNRKNIEYTNPAEYTRLTDGYEITPQASGDVVRFETAERFRYVVQYVLEWSLAFQTNQDLTSGDVWAVGYGDADLENSSDDTPGPSADGWLAYQNSSHAADEARIAEYRDGTEQDGRTVTLRKLPQTWGRLCGRTNWYNVGVTTLAETSAVADTRADDSGEPGPIQRNDPIGTVGFPGGKGPIDGNQHITATIKAGNSTSAGSLSMEIGSAGLRTLGDVQSIVRDNPHLIRTDVANDVFGTWEPIHAIRVDPNRSNVNTQIANANVDKFTGGADIQVLVLAVDETLTDASGFSTPPEHASKNSAVEVTDSVTTFPDSTGTVVSTTTDPGGWQLGYASLFTSGGGKTETGTGQARTEKRAIHEGNVAVVLANAGGTGTVSVEITTEQNW